MARRRRRRSSGISFGQLIVMAAVITIIVLWNKTNAPEGMDRQEGDFDVLAAVRLVEDRGNDGDSFRIQHLDQVETYRLYFVDTCEKNRRFTGRLEHQADYFGGLHLDDVVQLGEDARETTLDWLRHEPFEVYTRGESVMSSERLHAMIRFPESEPDREWLSQRLVSEGLARIYTRGTKLADGTSARAYGAKLRELEREAKSDGRGAWGY